MNQFEALDTLTKLAEATGIVVEPVHTETTAGLELVIMRTRGHLDMESREQLREAWKVAVAGTLLANVRLLLLGPDLSIELFRRGEAQPAKLEIRVDKDPNDPEKGIASFTAGARRYFIDGREVDLITYQAELARQLADNAVGADGQ